MIRQISYLLVLSFILFSLTGCSGGRNVAPVAERSASGSRAGEKWVTVRKGDTLFSISFANGRDHKSVARLNGIRPPYIIYPGQRIKVRGKSTSKKRYKNKTTKKRTASSSKKKTRSKKRAPVKSSVNWAWPANGKIIRAYSANAPRKKGIGITGKRGQAIKAAGSGKVVYSGDGLLGYGNLIIIKHNENYLSAYAHSLKVYVKEGQSVKRGQKVASMGDNEDGRAMLHFEIRRNGKPVSPVRYLPRR